jgi:hypothetical protein
MLDGPMLATSAAATWLAIVFVFGTTAALFCFGIRAPIHPPDPDWREHLPDPKRVPRSYWIVWGIGTGLLYTLALVAAITDEHWIAFMAIGAWVVTAVIRNVIAFKVGRRARQTEQR